MHVNSAAALVSGAAGAVVLTALHETLRRTVPYAQQRPLAQCRKTASKRLAHAI